MNSEPQMDTNEHKLLLKKEVFQVVDCAMEVLNTLGHGLLEKPYENALVVEIVVASVCQKTPLSELSCHDPPHFPRQLQPNFVQEDASDRSGWGDWWWTGPDLRDAAIGRRSRLLGSGFKG